MTSVCLSIGCERKPDVLVIGFTIKPLPLFSHPNGVRPEKRKSIESIVEHSSVHCSRLPLFDDLPCFVEPLQGNQLLTQVTVRIRVVGYKSKALPRDPCR